MNKISSIKNILAYVIAISTVHFDINVKPLKINHLFVIKIKEKSIFIGSRVYNALT
jgi:hypothetical protein